MAVPPPPMQHPVPIHERRCSYCGGASRLNRCEACGSRQFTQPMANVDLLKSFSAERALIHSGLKSIEQVRAEFANDGRV